jgi:hydrogenase-4 transcriptional activator
MLKITRDPNGEAVFKLSGRLGADNIPELEALFSAEGSDRPIVLDLKDLLLVDQDAVSSLSAAKRKASSSTIAQHTSESGSRENGDDQKKAEWRSSTSQTVRRQKGKIMAILDLIGSSERFQAVLDDVQVVAQSDCSVLLHGETGTGKEVVAHAIHDSSPRQRGPFVALNCAAIPAALLESELFGHEKGAFTGAVAQTIGRFQAAHGGTLFLDEIGDLPLELQPKLLRVLQEQQYERLGSTRTLHADVRVIAATNQDLARMVEEKTFRADLYYRLSVFPISLPPLRERREDIPSLVNQFVRRFSRRMGKSIDQVPDGVMQILQSHHWPGNIRELQNFIERSAILTEGRVLSPRVTELELLMQAAMSPPPQTLSDAERAHILGILKETNWIVGGRAGAAARLGLPRTTLMSRMRKLGIPTRRDGIPLNRTGSAPQLLAS